MRSLQEINDPRRSHEPPRPTDTPARRATSRMVTRFRRERELMRNSDSKNPGRSLYARIPNGFKTV
jgi:hypothetical protein